MKYYLLDQKKRKMYSSGNIFPKIQVPTRIKNTSDTSNFLGAQTHWIEPILEVTPWMLWVSYVLLNGSNTWDTEI